MPKVQMLKSMGAHELAEWEAYYGLEPFGEQRADFRIGQLTALLANIVRDKKKRARPFTWKDFVFKESGGQQLGWKDLVGYLKSMGKVLGSHGKGK